MIEYDRMHCTVVPNYILYIIMMSQNQTHIHYKKLIEALYHCILKQSRLSQRMKPKSMTNWLYFWWLHQKWFENSGDGGVTRIQQLDFLMMSEGKRTFFCFFVFFFFFFSLFPFFMTQIRHNLLIQSISYDIMLN